MQLYCEQVHVHALYSILINVSNKPLHIHYYIYTYIGMCVYLH